ncbi:plastocyanin/azurin family copper-binding protein [Nocardiopsis aegyptia]|uniref:plastocyanin/azurin family copper-binding protein n=1 Tax=Nocardiopsis aegyptia TaxID=220378 RepID=UPI00366E5D1B
MSRVTAAVLAAVLLGGGLLGPSACSRDSAHDQREVETPDGVERPEETPNVEKSDGEGEGGEVVRTVHVSAEEFAFAGFPETLPVGTVEFVLDNTGSVEHDLVLEELGDEVVVPETAPGESAAGRVALLQRGEYTFYCSVGDHRARGMEVTVTVE